MVERNLAKVEVESSRLFSRSRFKKGSLGFPFFLLEAGCSAQGLDNPKSQGIAYLRRPGYAATQVRAQQPAPRW